MDAPVGPRGYSRAAMFLAAGSLYLLIAAAFAFIFFFPVCGIGWAAVLFHLLGWYQLGIAVRANDVSGSRFAAATHTAFTLSIVSFVFGIATMPFLFPTIGYWPSLSFPIIVYGYFPFIPSVFAPVALCQAVVFLGSATTISSDRGRKCVMAGARFLAAVAAIALVFQFELNLLPSIWTLRLFWSFAGLTTFGYGLVALGWRIEGRRAASWIEASPAGTREGAD